MTRPVVQIQQPTPPTDEIDLSRAFHALRAHLPLILATTILAAAGAYAYSRSQTPIFEATTTILSAGNQTGNQTVNNTLVSAPPLPQGALEKALSSATVLTDIRNRITTLPGLTDTERTRLTTDLADEAANRKVSTFRLRGRLDPNGNGTYDLSAEHPRPTTAANLANVAADALVDWDTQRALQKVNTSRRALEAQLTDIDARLARETIGATPTLDQRSLLALRGERQDALNNVRALELAVSGTLSIVAPAVPPNDPIRPRPTRNAALAGLLGLLLSAGLVLLRSSLDRTVSTTADLRNLDLRPLGEIPRLKADRRNPNVLARLRRGQPAESIGFLRANLSTLLGKQTPKILLITSSTPNEGKSSLTAALADAFAGAGQRTLLIDADLRRPTQNKIWGIAFDTAEWVNLPGAAPFPSEEKRDTSTAMRAPEAAQAKRLRENLHLLPAGLANAHANDLFATGAFARAINTWAPGYDIILIDSPPALAVADPILMAPHATGTLIVLEAGRTAHQAVQRLADNLTMADARILGVALNKVDPRRQDNYYGGYAYGYSPRPTTTVADR